ncbi:MAG: sulfide/dihydroorotate dehydrogenase-like FAD/NAD-binding protein [Bacteroidetes bacterium]|nr:sulfide/dihydroorotate dehydrogenase-like FAD/NAD-binding protein [Bacteroidota bacterium]MCL5027154.1 sulfide/dihydroorotate dehydrogenase-like FAD/NAD-binding protein [Chloroflexota bacterium]
MYKILATETLTVNSKLFRVEAPYVARKARPGQFVVVVVDEQGERIPLTVADIDAGAGVITIIVQQVGKTTCQMATLEAGDSLAVVAGPMGLPSHLGNYGTVACLGGGFGMAAMFPIARALKQAGNKIIGIIGARNLDLLIWEDRLRGISDEFYVTTDDGSKGRKGFVTQVLQEKLEAKEKIDLVFGVGPVPMMRAMTRTTLPYGVKTIVSLNPVMIDATGLCGVCRVTVAGETKFACVDGPEFDAHQVDWDQLVARQALFVPEEKLALARFQERIAAQAGAKA